MAVPQSCTVLVIGGGPAGSYAAAALAREGIETVLLEADKFPRYHIGESTLPSLRHFFKFIDFYHTFDAHGFYHKNDTDFLEAGGPDAYAWNLIRSESDELLFRHAGTCGAHIFYETKPRIKSNRKSNGSLNPGRPVSVTWVRKDGTSGSINLKYLVDASGRHGILSTKYLKNRKFNDNFKNVANWAYWKTDKLYGPGTHMEGSPYFEALDGEFVKEPISTSMLRWQPFLMRNKTDSSGWAWFMPLHDGTRSVGIVQDQKLATEKKRELGRPSTLDFYKKCIEMAPRTKELLSEAELVTDVRSASDWSYTASAYHIPNARICGDAGSFIDPLFSSGVHLAVIGGLSAAATIAASIRGDCDEQTAGSWHSKKTVESYTRFFLAVSSATKQIREQHEPIIQDMDEEGFQRAFDLLRPIIQGTVDVDTTGKISQSEMSKALEFCFRAFTYVPPEQKDALFEKLEKLGVGSRHTDPTAVKALDDIQKHLTVDELQVLETLRSRRLIREDPFEMDSFTLDTIDGLAPNLGSLLFPAIFGW
ncbi:FAD/NAD(P)-binding domain-containing protein [Penicillium herquei]|nr:FAD/NAD(P)-binding domain-containing protein [Penicillium herquei]